MSPEAERPWITVPLEEAHKNPNGIIIDTTWVDDPVKMKSRMCGREFNSSGPRDDLFAGTPPLLATKLLISECASRAYEKEACRLMVLDVKRAFLYGRARRDIYIKLPPEDPRYGTGVVGKLERSLYGTRDAPEIWQDELKSSMEELGFRSCLSNPGGVYAG